MQRVSGYRSLAVLLVASLLLAFTAVACDPSTESDTETTVVELATDAAETEGLWVRIKAFFAQVATRVAGAPVIGDWFQKLLDRLAPEHQWCAGGMLVSLVVVLVIAAASTGRD